MGRRDEPTRPCEHCGKPVTRTAREAAQRRHWTCNASCAASLSHRLHGSNRRGGAPNPLRGQQATEPCAVCGASITRYLSPVNAARRGRWTCSRSCAATSRNRARVAAGTWVPPRKPQTGDTVPCAVCGTPFYRQPAYIAQGRKYCSRACNAIGQSKTPVVKACVRCGKERRLKPSQAAIRYCSKTCESLDKIKRPTGREHNGRPVVRNAQGYLTVYEPGHPNANRSGRVLEHRWIMERALGRPLTRHEQVDHINRDRADNRPENLQVLSQEEHTVKSNGERRDDRKRLKADLAELARYRRLYGPLPETSQP